ncbi:MAG TPA: ribonuclease III [Candidatus Acidoferrum sp.]|nr:ribonuclease III [Candidatus Acidoferrum sp.]
MAHLEDDELQGRLGYRFNNRQLLVTALTHSSAIPELRTAAEALGGDPAVVQDNERLEFLGDAVLDLLASEYLLENFPSWSEGQLSRSRAYLVNAQALEIAARKLGIGEFLRLGRGEEKTGGREKAAIIADSLEAIVAAIYLDAGLGEARRVLHRVLFESALELGGVRIAESDRKSALQEFLQGKGRPPAEYRLAGETGPDHQKLFYVEVWSQGEFLASGQGNTKKEAEQKAARLALERLQEQADVPTKAE